MKRGQQHDPACRCFRCYAAALGSWIGELGALTICGCWVWLVTISYRTSNYPWGRGFPLMGAGKPNPDFAHRLFDRLVDHLEAELGSRVEFVASDEYGTQNGRFHQHALLSSPGLASYSTREIEHWLKARAGWSRVRPFRAGAARYLAKNIGRKLGAVDWRVEVGNAVTRTPVEIGRTVIAASASVPGEFFHQSFPHRKR
jgi:hypothetical protein